MSADIQLCFSFIHTEYMDFISYLILRIKKGCMNYLLKSTICYSVACAEGYGSLQGENKNCKVMCCMCLTGTGYRDRRSFSGLVSRHNWVHGGFG